MQTISSQFGDITIRCEVSALDSGTFAAWAELRDSTHTIETEAGRVGVFIHGGSQRREEFGTVAEAEAAALRMARDLAVSVREAIAVADSRLTAKQESVRLAKEATERLSTIAL
jgi:hypothetical protein